MNRWCVRGIRDDDKGGRGLRMGQKDLQRQWRRRWRTVILKTSTTTTEATEKDRKRVQWIRYNDWGSSGSTKGPIDWQRRMCVDVLAIVSLTVTLSCLFLVAISFWYFFHHISLFCSLQKRISLLQSCGKDFCTKYTISLRMYPLRTVELKNHKFLWSIKTYARLQLV